MSSSSFLICNECEEILLCYSLPVSTIDFWHTPRKRRNWVELSWLRMEKRRRTTPSSVTFQLLELCLIRRIGTKWHKFPRTGCLSVEKPPSVRQNRKRPQFDRTDAFHSLIWPIRTDTEVWEVVSAISLLAWRSCWFLTSSFSLTGSSLLLSLILRRPRLFLLDKEFCIEFFSGPKTA